MFWAELEKEIGVVPENIKFIVRHTNYLNGALADLKDEDISNMESDMRRSACGMYSELDKCFERFAYEPERFYFVAGERAILRLISKTIQKKGAKHYFKRPRSTNVAENCRTTREPESHHGPTVKQKIIEFFAKRYYAFIHGRVNHEI